ncbi:MAG TPA: hypothetical protein VKA70_03120 [Blastocatellia bacterium]|nr:hypothetical protein [Blastocatellia bacterium]
MINILSVNCGLAFAPYLSECAHSFLRQQAATARVIRQAATGLIIRAEESFSIRHQNREAVLSLEDLGHYSQTIDFRVDSYEVLRTSDELVLANIGRSLLISYPQSELWLEPENVERLVAIFRRGSATEADEIDDALSLPDWLSVSSSGGRLLLSDQRNGRWSLLGSDHIAELERRLEALRRADDSPAQPGPPTINMKGVIVHLQSASRLAGALELFAETGEVSPFEETAPTFQLRVSRSTEGLEVRDSAGGVGVTAREARKWVAIIRDELARVKAAVIERGSIRTVFADGPGGRWVLQWGDEVLVSASLLSRLPDVTEGIDDAAATTIALRKTPDFLLFLSTASGGCVALTDKEAALLAQSTQAGGGQ